MTTSTGEPSLADLISYQISPDWLAEQTFTERDASAVASIIDDIAERIAHHPIDGQPSTKDGHQI